MVLGVVGGIGQSWRTRLLVEACVEAAQAEGMRSEILDLSEAPIDFAANKAPADYSSTTQRAIALTQEADGFVFGSPIYRAAYTGVLKNYFDLLPVEALVGKVAGLVATGASYHHYLALEVIFRPLVTFFNMHSVPGVLYGAPSDYTPERQLTPSIQEQAQQMGHDVAYMAHQLGGRGYGPANAGVAAVLQPKR